MNEFDRLCSENHIQKGNEGYKLSPEYAKELLDSYLGKGLKAYLTHFVEKGKGELEFEADVKADAESFLKTKKDIFQRKVEKSMWYDILKINSKNLDQYLLSYLVRTEFPRESIEDCFINARKLPLELIDSQYSGGFNIIVDYELLRYLNERLSTFHINSNNKIEWLGDQKELGELFVELEKKGWIKKIKPVVVKACFSNTHTIQQILKAGQDRKDPENKPYPQIYTPKYEPKFYGIKENKT